jgi:DNA-binding NarL/FixJ family response regulator
MSLSTRILVVDDYKPFVRFVRSTLGNRPELQIVGEASDGLEAVQKAEQLRPDLILLDIGLPTLNGIDAARRIRQLSPESKILFVSQESSPDVVKEALTVGALGFLVKTHAGSGLLPAVEAVRRGREFISGGVPGLTVTNSAEAQGLGSPDHAEAPPSSAPRKVDITRNHAVEFYSDDASFVLGFTRFIEAALRAGNAVIVIATESHRKSLLVSLPEVGVNIAAAIEEGRYLALDVAETLSTFMVNDQVDAVRALKGARDLLSVAAKAANGSSRVAACGEIAPALWSQDKPDAAIQIEHLWDEVARTFDVEILCGYLLDAFQREEGSHIYDRICAEHSDVRPH